MTHTYRIVVGVDGSEGGLHALRWAFREAGTRGGTVHAVTVWSWDNVEHMGVSYAEQQHAAGEKILSEAISKALSDNPHVTVSTQVVCDRPAAGLAAAARGADLLVLGSHGHSRISHAVLGSVADETIRAAECPVVVIPSHLIAQQEAAAQAAAVA